MSEGIMKKFKKLITIEGEDDTGEEECGYDNEAEEDMYIEETTKLEHTNTQSERGSNVYNLHGNGQLNSQMKLVIEKPKKYDDVTLIADHLKENKAVIMNLENIEGDSDLRKSIYFFASGVVYVLDGTMQKISKSIFLLAPNNVDIDANIKKELESKALFPWQK